MEIRTPSDLQRIVWITHKRCGCAWIYETLDQVAFCPEHTKNPLTNPNRRCKIPKSTRKTKVPAPMPQWVCKCSWRSTAKIIIVPAKTAEAAWDVAWRKVSRMEGGDSCLKVIVLKQKETHGTV